jgi:hypothetical protein
MYLGVIRSMPTASIKVTIKKYKRKNYTNLIYLTFMHCTCKFENYKQSFLSENNEQTFPNKKHKQSNAHERHKETFPSENYNRICHTHARTSSAYSITPRSLKPSFVVASFVVASFVEASFVVASFVVASFVVASFVVAYPTVLSLSADPNGRAY